MAPIINFFVGLIRGKDKCLNEFNKFYSEGIAPNQAAERRTVGRP